MDPGITATSPEQSLSLVDDPAADADEGDKEATAPLSREVSELETRGIFPGVPLS